MKETNKETKKETRQERSAKLKRLAGLSVVLLKLPDA
jgi:hypothetical protein